MEEFNVDFAHVLPHLERGKEIYLKNRSSQNRHSLIHVIGNTTILCMESDDEMTNKLGEWIKKFREEIKQSWEDK